jgi:uncharacterized protein (DUF983 family)
MDVVHTQVLPKGKHCGLCHLYDAFVRPKHCCQAKGELEEFNKRNYGSTVVQPKKKRVDKKEMLKQHL